MGLARTDWLQLNCDDLNKAVGDLKGLDCPECLNRGWINAVKGNDIIARPCSCMKKRASLNRIAQSGLSDSLNKYTFEAYVPYDKFTEQVKEKALAYTSCNTGSWFFAGGQVGFGKTHICTAIAGVFLEQGKSVRYMRWRDDSVKIKACVNDDCEYDNLVRPFKTADVLYIDDLFKTARGEDGKAKLPTPADVNLAFEIINYRYNDSRLITIISCESVIDDLLAIDEAVGGRIYERSKEYCIVIPREKSRDYRLKGATP